MNRKAQNAIRVTLTKSEALIVHSIAEQRFRSNRKGGVANSKVGDQSDELTDLNGFGGEVAFCKVFNLFPDFNIIPGGGEDLADCVLRDGRRVDVKTSTYPTGNLVARKVQDDIDIFVLVRGKLPDYEIVGYAERKQLADAPKRNLGHGLTHFLSASELRPISELMVYPDINHSTDESNEGQDVKAVTNDKRASEEYDDEPAWSTEDYADYLGWDEDSGMSASDWIDAFEPDYD